jgi:hypothetical protein
MSQILSGLMDLLDLIMDYSMDTNIKTVWYVLYCLIVSSSTPDEWTQSLKHGNTCNTTSWLWTPNIRFKKENLRRWVWDLTNSLGQQKFTSEWVRPWDWLDLFFSKTNSQSIGNLCYKRDKKRFWIYFVGLNQFHLIFLSFFWQR